MASPYVAIFECDINHMALKRAIMEETKGGCHVT
ncbi:hypothetical protein SAMN04489737_0677 [Arcanobacterium phocae]|uniref:Uncharacterized protein n=1 Tax=Arcanobacterium phocae TaxID=131112 RepID=A0A1H2LDD8_9ACTO|nr:hypothetical protein SAMN04489737_0677 [Arcanobacterium phocae]